MALICPKQGARLLNSWLHEVSDWMIYPCTEAEVQVLGINQIRGSSSLFHVC